VEEHSGDTMRKILIIPVLIALAAIMVSCSPSKPARPVQQVGKDSIKPELMELDSVAVAFWAINKAEDRTLVRLASFDGMKKLEDTKIKYLKSMIQDEDFKTLARVGYAPENKLYDSDSAVYVAYKLGLIKEVYWVVPVFGSITPENLEGFKEYLKKTMPDQAEVISKLTLKDNIAEGKINDVPVKIVSLEDLPNMPKPVLLDVDLSYLSSLYQDETNTRSLSFISGFFATLTNKNIKTDMLSMSFSCADAKAQLRHRSFVFMLRDLFNKPELISGIPPKLWADRAEAWKAMEKSPKESIPILEDIIKEYPKDAASHYDLATMYLAAGDKTDALGAFQESVKLDPAYNLAADRFK
jgi:tetratricopeptide (TPR) repeat protein